MPSIPTYQEALGSLPHLRIDAPLLSQHRIEGLSFLLRPRADQFIQVMVSADRLSLRFPHVLLQETVTALLTLIPLFLAHSRIIRSS